MKQRKSKLAEIKTKPTQSSVIDFINNIEDEQKRLDSFKLIEMMENATNEKAVLWGNSLIGFGNKRYKSERTGREVDWLLIGFSPRKASLSLYLTMDINKHQDLLVLLGKHKTGAGCLYINKLSDIKLDILKRIINEALQ